MFLWLNPGVLQAFHQHWICSGKFVVVSAIDGFDQDSIAVYFDHDHYVFVSSLRMHGKPTSLVGEYCLAYVIHFCEYIAYFLAHELRCVELFKRGLSQMFPCSGFGFYRTHILSCLIHLSFRGFCGFWIIFVDILVGEERQTNVISCLYSLEPC